MRLILICLLIAALMATVVIAAEENTFINQSVRLTAEMRLNGHLFPIYQVNISIWDPNGTLVLDNQQMTNYFIGSFYYDFLPNQTGLYVYNTKYYNSIGIYVGGATSNVIVYEPKGNDMAIGIATVVGIGFILAILIYIAFKVDPKNHFPIQLLFLFIVLQGLLVLSTLAISYDEKSNTILETFNTILQYANWIFAGYVVIYFIWVLLSKFGFTGGKK